MQEGENMHIFWLLHAQLTQRHVEANTSREYRLGKLDGRQFVMGGGCSSSNRQSSLAESARDLAKRFSAYLHQTEAWTAALQGPQCRHYSYE